MRLESALVVRRLRPRSNIGDIGLGFKRLTCVPIQVGMVKGNLLSKEEKQWLKVNSQLSSPYIV